MAVQNPPPNPQGTPRPNNIVQVPATNGSPTPVQRRIIPDLAHIDNIPQPEGLIPSFIRFLGLPTNEQRMFLEKASMDWTTAFQQYLADTESAAQVYVSRLIKETARTLQADMGYLNDYNKDTPMYEFLLEMHKLDLEDLRELRQDLIHRPP